MNEPWQQAVDLANLMEGCRSEEDVSELMGGIDLRLAIITLCLFAWRTRSNNRNASPVPTLQDDLEGRN